MTETGTYISGLQFVHVSVFNPLNELTRNTHHNFTETEQSVISHASEGYGLQARVEKDGGAIAQ
jgi:hypothetical protein